MENETKIVQCGAYKETCLNCNKTDYNDRNTRSIENDVICTHCMSEATHYLAKGLLTNEEIYNYYEEKKQYKATIDALYREMRKHNSSNKTNYKENLDKVVSDLDEMAVGMFYKVYDCCKMPERIQLLVVMISKFPKTNIVLGDKSHGEFWKKFYSKFG